MLLNERFVKYLTKVLISKIACLKNVFFNQNIKNLSGTEIIIIGAKRKMLQTKNSSFYAIFYKSQKVVSSICMKNIFKLCICHVV